MCVSSIREPPQLPTTLEIFPRQPWELGLLHHLSADGAVGGGLNSRVPHEYALTAATGGRGRHRRSPVVLVRARGGPPHAVVVGFLVVVDFLVVPGPTRRSTPVDGEVSFCQALVGDAGR